MSKIYENIEILIKVQFILVTPQRPILRKNLARKCIFCHSAAVLQKVCFAVCILKL